MPPDIKVSGTFKDYYNLLNKQLQYYINYYKTLIQETSYDKYRNFFQYNSGDLVYIIMPLTVNCAPHLEK